MSKIRVLSDHIANQIAAGEVVERPASVAKELVENSIDAGARRVEVEVEAGGRRLLRVSDDGEGMTRDDAVLAFERHATSKISSAEDLSHISTLGFRGEALASIASVARVELITQTEDSTEGTRVLVEGGRMRDVSPAARPRGTTISVRDLFFNIPARRKFLRSEATESFHLTNLVTHYALAHPEIAFALTNNGREILRAAAASDLRERAYQIFGEEFLENLLEVNGGQPLLARVRGYISAPRERRTTRDAQYLFVNGRYVRDRLIARALSEGYRTVLPQGVYPAALLFLEVPLEEVDVNVHPAKTEVRFRRASAIADSVREAVRAALAAGGYLKPADDAEHWGIPTIFGANNSDTQQTPAPPREPEGGAAINLPPAPLSSTSAAQRPHDEQSARQESIEFGWTPSTFEEPRPQEKHDDELVSLSSAYAEAAHAAETARRHILQDLPPSGAEEPEPPASEKVEPPRSSTQAALPPLDSAAPLVRETPVESLTHDIRPLGQMNDSYIVATDPEGLLLIDQHAAHERILFEKYRTLEATRAAESQNLLVPETFDLTPAQAVAFDALAPELERYGFSLMRLSGRTVAVRAVPADLPAGESSGLLADLLTSSDRGRRDTARETLREEVAARLACRAAVKSNTPLSIEKMRWLIERLLQTSSPTTCPHGRPVILRLARKDIERGFRRQ